MKVYQITKLPPPISLSKLTVASAPPPGGLPNTRQGSCLGARGWVTIQRPALPAPTVPSARQWKPGPPKETEKGRHVFMARAICQFSFGPFQGRSGAPAAAEEGPVGSAQASLPEKQSPREKNHRREAPRGPNGGHPGPLLRALYPPSRVGLLSAAKHSKCYSQNMLLGEDFTDPATETTLHGGLLITHVGGPSRLPLQRFC